MKIDEGLVLRRHVKASTQRLERAGDENWNRNTLDAISFGVPRRNSIRHLFFSFRRCFAQFVYNCDGQRQRPAFFASLLRRFIRCIYTKASSDNNTFSQLLYGFPSTHICMDLLRVSVLSFLFNVYVREFICVCASHLLRRLFLCLALGKMAAEVLDSFRSCCSRGTRWTLTATQFAHFLFQFLRLRCYFVLVFFLVFSTLHLCVCGR